MLGGAKKIFFNQILNMFIVTAFNRLLFRSKNLFHKSGIAQQLNLYFANFFLHNYFEKPFLDFAVYFLIDFTM